MLPVGRVVRQAKVRQHTQGCVPGLRAALVENTTILILDFPPFTSGLKINAREAGNACPGNGNIVMSGFTAATDTTLNGIYSRVPTTLMKCRNVAGTLTDGTDSANTAGCAPYCQNRGASAKDKCIGDGGRE